MDVCEVDPDLVRVAEMWFGFNQNSDRMTVQVEDGVDFILKKAASTEEIGKLSKVTITSLLL